MATKNAKTAPATDAAAQAAAKRTAEEVMARHGSEAQKANPKAAAEALAAKKEAEATEAEAPKAEATEAQAPKAKEPRTKWTDDVRLTLNRKGNPKRPGSDAHARFQFWVDRGTATVGEYLDACVALEGRQAKPRHRYLMDVNWDTAESRGFLRPADAE